ncbi:ribonuclease-like 3 [Sinocyclocheilus anshuiensis]|uniref:ribonuclease-like 3 n=1 Tax=Sinocyclocheilus anshuiensis TaxID=1608454 RepID=UPI0007B9BFA1|nr:PREDICTED: ribonuclease-like 3 [Sinocyclocheilus anshuiensis]
MGIHHSIMILLLVLCASLFICGQTDEEVVEQRYKKFIRQHVFGAMNVQRCDSEIRTRRITGSQDDNSCKEVNTFILANNKQVKAVCTGGGTRRPENRDLYISNKPFPVVTCTLISGERHPRCEYRGHRSTRRIVVGCAGDRPTHFEEGVIV